MHQPILDPAFEQEMLDRAYLHRERAALRHGVPTQQVRNIIGQQRPAPHDKTEAAAEEPAAGSALHLSPR